LRFGLSEIADVVTGHNVHAPLALSTEFSDLRYQPQQILRRQHKLGVRGHGACGDGILQLPRTDARLDEQIPDSGQLLAIALMDRGVDGHFQVDGAHGADGFENARVGTGRAKSVVLGFETVETEADGAKTSARCAFGITRAPCPGIRDEPHSHLLLGQPCCQLVPRWMQGGLAAGQGDTLATQLCQFIRHAQAFVPRQLVLARIAGKRPAMLAAHRALEG